MIEKLDINLIKTDEEVEKEYADHEEDYVEKRIKSYHDHPSLYKEQLQDAEYYARKEFKESHYGGEKGKDKFWKDCHNTLSAYGQQKVLNKLDEVIDALNEVVKQVNDASTMAQIERIGTMAESLKGVADDES